MIVVPLEQGTEEWLKYRRAHGMASESPSLMGTALYHPFTSFQPWLVKKGLTEVSQHPGMSRGLEFEAFARAKFAEDYCLREIKPIVVEEDTLKVVKM